MCFIKEISTDVIPKDIMNVAENDIEVYKIVKRYKEYAIRLNYIFRLFPMYKYCAPYYMAFDYKKNKRYKTFINPKILVTSGRTKTCIMVNEGFHSFDTVDNLKNSKTYSDFEYLIQSHTAVVGKFIIPKGAHYIQNDAKHLNMIVSDEIIFKGVIDNNEILR